MRAPSLLMLLAASAFAGACGGKAAPETPAPEATPAPAPPAPTPVDDSADRDRLERERIAREAAERARAVAADLAAMINFDYDQAVVRPADQATLDRKAVILVANPGVKLRIAGHADERGSDEYNLALGNRRAAAAKRYLENKGVDASRLEESESMIRCCTWISSASWAARAESRRAVSALNKAISSCTPWMSPLVTQPLSNARPTPSWAPRPSQGSLNRAAERGRLTGER